MKQLSAIFLVLAMVLALTACGKGDDRNNGGSPGRPDTNQSQNAPQDNGSGGSWQNGTDTPTQPGRRRKPAKWGGYAARHAGGGTYAPRRGAHRHLPPDAGKRLCPRQRRLPRRRRKHQLVTFFAKTAAVSAKNADGRRENTFFALCPLGIFEKMGYDMGERICAAAGGREKKGLL